MDPVAEEMLTQVLGCLLVPTLIVVLMIACLDSKFRSDEFVEKLIEKNTEAPAPFNKKLPAVFYEK